jgi:hypothetical protein
VLKAAFNRNILAASLFLLLSCGATVDANEPDVERLMNVRDEVLRQSIEAEQSRTLLEEAGIELGTWQRIGPFRDQQPLLNWMDNVASSFATEFGVETDCRTNDNVPILDKTYSAPNFPIDPDATRQWTSHSDWVDGYYQELPRGPAPSSGESQYLYRTISVDHIDVDAAINVGADIEDRTIGKGRVGVKKTLTISLDFILRSPEADRRMDEPGMEHWRRTGRYHVSLNGDEILRWEGRGDMPRAVLVDLHEGDNHLLAKVTNNRHAYGFAFSIQGLHPQLRHEVGFERAWRPFGFDTPIDKPYFHEKDAVIPEPSSLNHYRFALQQLVDLKFHPEAMPGVEHAVRDATGRVVPAMEAALDDYPTSPEGDRHCERLAELERMITPLLEQIKTGDDPLYEKTLAAADAIDAMWEETIRELPPLIYLERPSYSYDAIQFTNAGTSEAKLCVFDPKTKSVRTLYDFRSDGGRVQAHEFNLSFDGETIYLGGGERIHAINADGSDLRLIQNGQSPCEMPDGRLAFFDDDTGQSPCKAEGPRRLLYICDADGENRKVVSANNTIDNTPTVMNDGRILFARWDYGVNKNVFNRHAIWFQNPDGSAMDLYYGNTTIDPRGFYRPRQLPGRPEIMVVFGPHHNNVAGLVGLVWNGAGREAADGLGFRRLVHDTASVGDQAPSWSYQDPYPLNEQLFLVSYGGRPDRQVGLYLLDRSGNKKCIIEAEGSLGVHSAQPFVARERPPVLLDRTDNPVWQPGEDLHERLLNDPDWDLKGTLLLQDVYQGLEPEIERGRIKYLAVMEQPAQTHGRGGAIGVGTIWYVNRCVGLVPIEEDGSAYFEVPALRSLYFHVLDEDGRMLMTQGSDFHVMPGESRSCIGCHEQRKGIGSPPATGLPLAARKPPVRPAMPDWGTNGIIEYETVVQPVLDEYCVECHGGATPDANLNLTGDRTSVYNMSYLELTDRMLVHFTPGTGRTHAQPSNDSDEQAPLSRGSVLSEITAHLEGHPTCGEALPLEDRLKIFLWIDSNVPFYSHYRQISPTELEPEARAHLASIWGQRCASCHAEPGRSDTLSGLNIYHTWVHTGPRPGEWGVAESGMRARHLNLTHPEHSATLQAPLAEIDGGWGLCRHEDGSPVFESRNDPDYMDMLYSLRAESASKGHDDSLPFVGIQELLRRRDEPQEPWMRTISTP